MRALLVRVTQCSRSWEAWISTVRPGPGSPPTMKAKVLAPIILGLLKVRPMLGPGRSWSWPRTKSSENRTIGDREEFCTVIVLSGWTRLADTTKTAEVAVGFSRVPFDGTA